MDKLTPEVLAAAQAILVGLETRRHWINRNATVGAKSVNVSWDEAAARRGVTDTYIAILADLTGSSTDEVRAAFRN